MYTRLLEESQSVPLANRTLYLGETGRVILRTFDIGGKFAFEISSRRAMSNEPILVTKTLVEHLRDLGIPHHIEAEGDEHTRAEATKKMAQREFADGHLDEIIAEFQSGGLARSIAYALSNPSYRPQWVRMSEEPCTSCGREYMNGILHFPDRHSPFGDVYLTNMHALAMHPATYELSDDLEDMKRLLEASRGFVPAFIEAPAVLRDMQEFGIAFEAYTNAQGESYGFWEATRGGIRGEPEQFEDDPGLRKLAEEEKRIEERVSQTLTRAHDAAQKVHRTYVENGGTDQVMKNYELLNFWANQLMVYNVYYVFERKLLASEAGIELPQPFDLSRG